MIREVDLVSYLPPFMAEFKEIMATLEAENPEFVLVWEAADRVLQMNSLKHQMNTGFPLGKDFRGLPQNYRYARKSPVSRHESDK